MAAGRLIRFDGKLAPLVLLAGAVDHKTVINARYDGITCIFCLFAY
jgi:hypothetical protein